MRQKNVLIVAEGGFGSVKQEQYDETAGMLKRSLERKTRQNSSRPREEEKVFASVEIVGTAKEVIRKALNDFDILIFLTCAQANAARAVKKERPRVNVIIFTGLIPDEEIIWIDKGWSLEVFEGIVTHL